MKFKFEDIADITIDMSPNYDWPTILKAVEEKISKSCGRPDIIIYDVLKAYNAIESLNKKESK
jgi:hypothetical protein